MKHTLVVTLCFLPLAAIWLIMKLSLWVAAVNEEQNYVKDDAKRSHGPYVENSYGDIDQESEED